MVKYVIIVNKERLNTVKPLITDNSKWWKLYWNLPKNILQNEPSGKRTPLNGGQNLNNRECSVFRCFIVVKLSRKDTEIHQWKNLELERHILYGVEKFKYLGVILIRVN